MCVCVTGGAYMHGCGACGWRAYVCVWVVVVVFSDQTNIVRDSLRVGSESKIIVALQN